MTENNYDVYVVEKRQVSYQAIIDQTARFDGLYEEKMWPYNHGEVAGNHDARPLHGQTVQVVAEVDLNTGMTFVGFNRQRKQVWMPKDGIIAPTQKLEVTSKNQLAMIGAVDIDAPYFTAVPETQGRRDVPVGYVNRNHLADQSVLLIAEAVRADGQVFDQFLLNGTAYWIDKQRLTNIGKPLTTLLIGTDGTHFDGHAAKMASVTVRQPDGTSLNTRVLLKIQGNYTQKFNRHNFELSFTDDLNSKVARNVQFGDWQPRHKFSLRGDYTDQTHVRNTAGYRIWREILATEPVYSDQVQDKEMLGTIQGQPVTVFFNGANAGIYTLSSYFDADSIQLNSGDENQVLLLALNGYVDNEYLAFSNPKSLLNDTDFGVMSKQQPGNRRLTGNTNRLLSFIHDATDAEFREQATDYFDPLNLIDYYLFVGAIDAFDNLTHNTTLFTYDGAHWLFSLIDLDISFDIDADGKLLSNPKPVFSTFESPLFNRIIQCFKPELKQRWLELRQNLLSEEHLISTYSQAMAEIGPENYRNDRHVWRSPTGHTSSLENVSNFIEKHLPWCDKQIQQY